MVIYYKFVNVAFFVALTKIQSAMPHINVRAAIIVVLGRIFSATTPPTSQTTHIFLYAAEP